MEEVHVGEEFLLGGIAEGHGAGGGKGAFAFFEQLQHGVLDNLGVHHEGGQLGAFAQVVEHGVGHIAHTGLQGQEFLGQAAALVLGQEEAHNVGANLLRNFVDSGEGLHAVVGAGAHNANHLGGIDFQDGRAGAVVGSEDGDFAAVRGIVRQVDVVHAQERFGQLIVELDEDVLGQLCIGGDVAHTAAQHHFAVGGDVGSFDDGEVDIAVCAVAHFLGHLGEVAVKVVAVVGVDALAEVGHVLVGCTHIVGVGARQSAVYALPE